jgi:hypothetical protein
MQHFVRAGFNAWDHMGWAEANLLYFSKVVWGVLIQHHFPHWDQREVLLRPHLCHSSIWCQQSWCIRLETEIIKFSPSWWRTVYCKYLKTKCWGKSVRFCVLMLAGMKMTVFWNGASCSLIDITAFQRCSLPQFLLMSASETLVSFYQTRKLIRHRSDDINA